MVEVVAPRAAPPQREPLPFVLDFEDGVDPVVEWTSNGTYKVHFKGVTEEKAHSGRRSLKLDLEFAGATYVYLRIPVRVPAEGRLRGRAFTLAGAGNKGRAGVGVNILYPPSSLSGCGEFGDESRSPAGETWVLAEEDLVQRAEAGARRFADSSVAFATGADLGRVVDRIGIFLRGRPGQRAVVYIDDIRLEGETPPNGTYTKAVQARWAPAAVRMSQGLAVFRDSLSRTSADVEAMAPTSTAARAVAEAFRRQHGEMEARVRGYAGKTTLPRREWEELLQRAGRIQDTPATLRELESGAARFEGMLVHALENPIASVRILPSDALVPAPIATRLGMTAARGSFESASVIVQALRDVKGARLEVGDLHHEDGRTQIPAGQMDVRIVKCWYQSPRAWLDIGQSAGAPVLTPELLLHDDALVRVDPATQKNSIRLSHPGGDAYVDATDRMFPGVPGGRPVSAAVAPVRDAPALCPVDISSGEVRQYWLTLRVPPHAAAGVYSGEVRMVEGSAVRAAVPLRVTVLPFELPMPRTRHDPARPFISSIYYRGRLNLADFPEGTLTSEAKSLDQMRAELRDMFEHNIHNPAVYQPEEGLDVVLRLRNESGMAGLPLFWVGGGTGAPRTPAALARLKERAARAKVLAAPFGVTELYMYGTDEARGDALLIQRDAWTAVHEAGARVFVAGYKGQVKVVGDLLDVQIQAGGPDPDEVRAWHAAGHRIFCYANPQTGPENPEVFRRNYGFLLWASDYDGAMTYAYQHGFGGIYDDADHATYRDHVFSYPTSDGVIPTLAIEGYREGIDDIRYATLLASQVAKHASSPGPKGEAARSAAAFLSALDPKADPGATRKEIVRRILPLLD